MCNLYRVNSSPAQLIAALGLPDDSQLPEISAEFYPGRPAPVVREDVTNHRRQLEEMIWGFPPFKGKRPINNTRSERAAVSPMWKQHLNCRCVFPLSAAVEWQHQVNTNTGEVRKVPHTIRFRDDRLAAVAGIYRPGREQSYSSMMTCRANVFWSTIHNKDPDDPRMICFLLTRDEIAQWLNPDQPYEAVAHLLRPAPDDADLLTAEPLTAGPGPAPSNGETLFG